MKNYSVAVVLWRDHVGCYNTPMIKNPDIETEKLTMSVGIVYKETDSTLVLVSDIEAHDEDVDKCNYVLILKSAIVSIEKYGSIKLRKLRY